ncbi:hypothetical protein DZS_51050 [Dickeya ananatis]
MQPSFILKARLACNYYYCGNAGDDLEQGEENDIEQYDTNPFDKKSVQKKSYPT